MIICMCVCLCLRDILARTHTRNIKLDALLAHLVIVYICLSLYVWDIRHAAKMPAHRSQYFVHNVMVNSGNVRYTAESAQVAHTCEPTKKDWVVNVKSRVTRMLVMMVLYYYAQRSTNWDTGDFYGEQKHSARLQHGIGKLSVLDAWTCTRIYVSCTCYYNVLYGRLVWGPASSSL